VCSSDLAGALTETATATRCVVGRVVLIASVTNASNGSIRAEVATPFGTRTTTGLPAGATRSFAFTTRAASIDASEVVISATGEGEDGGETLAYEPASCS